MNAGDEQLAITPDHPVPLWVLDECKELNHRLIQSTFVVQQRRRDTIRPQVRAGAYERQARTGAPAFSFALRPVYIALALGRYHVRTGSIGHSVGSPENNKDRIDTAVRY